MSKLKQLMLCCLLFMAYLNYPLVVTENALYEDGASIIIIANSTHNGWNKGSSIQASIDGHYLSIVFTENLGQVAVDVTTSSGAPVETLEGATPTGMLIYIALAGDYIVNFTLPNGDEYYGEFTVTD